MQIGIVERRAVRVHQRIAELAALVDRAGRFRRGVAGNAAGKRELLEQPFQHPASSCDDIRVQLAVSALEVGVGHQPPARRVRDR